MLGRGDGDAHPAEELDQTPGGVVGEAQVEPAGGLPGGLMFLPDLDRALAGVHRVLVPGGRFAAAIPWRPADQPMPRLVGAILDRLGRPWFVARTTTGGATTAWLAAAWLFEPQSRPVDTDLADGGSPRGKVVADPFDTVQARLPS